jgi:hypothetical protein
MKQCTKCHETRSLDRFYDNARTPDGKSYVCKDCIRAAAREWQMNNREKANARLRAYRQTDTYRERERIRTRMRDQLPARRAMKLRIQKLERQTQPEKRRARDAVRNALLGGRLVQSARCKRCQRIGKTEAHHSDYSKPLEVEWLCKLCHVEADKETRTTALVD